MTRAAALTLTALAALTAAGALLLGARGTETPSATAAPAGCVDGGAHLAIDLRRDEAVRLRVGAGGKILADGEQCGAATTATAQTIEVSGAGGRQRVAVDLGGESFGGVELALALGRGERDAVAVLGRDGGESHQVSRRSISLDPATGAGVSLARVERLSLNAKAGSDHIDAHGWRRPLALEGGHGPDALHGGHGGDALWGGAGSDRLLGGAKADRLDGGPGEDRCIGGAGTDALLGCMPPFDGSSSPIDSQLRDRMTGRSWHRGCPVGLGRLRLLEVPHWTMGDRDVHRGRLVVHQDADRDVLRALRGLLHARFPVRRMELIDRYGGDDHRSMNADNTSAFNCRFVAGTTRWSEHAFGRALDLNPIENPYVSGSHVSPPAGRPYADRSRRAAGMVHRGDGAYRAFARVGWEWGGNWPGTKDYQHFSASGR